jgi:hypothetical protein
MLGEYRFAGTVEPIVILGLARGGELRIIGQDGRFRTVGEHRVTLRRLAS